MAEYLCEEDMSTGEYISRDVALRQLNATCLATECNNYNGVMCRACAYEVQPVKRGKWEKKKGYLVCSNCGMTVDTIGYTYEEQEEVFRYCSCCGYRMDGDSECQ